MAQLPVAPYPPANFKSADALGRPRSNSGGGAPGALTPRDGETNRRMVRRQAVPADLASYSEARHSLRRSIRVINTPTTRLLRGDTRRCNIQG